MRINVRGGTAKHDGADLCNSCKSCTRIEGDSDSVGIKYCHVLSRTLGFKVTNCTEHREAGAVSLQAMTDVAWILDPSAAAKKKGYFGFFKAEELRNIYKDINKDFEVKGDDEWAR